MCVLWRSHLSVGGEVEGEGEVTPALRSQDGVKEPGVRTIGLKEWG